MLSNYGFKPKKIPAGEKITFLLKTSIEYYEDRRYYYGRHGYPDDYKGLDQPQDFEVKDSEHN